MAKEITVFDIKLGNCGTSELFSVTLDNDCIVINGKNTRKVVLKFLKNGKNSIEVRFFYKKGNTYFKKFNLGNTDDDNEPKSRSLLNVAAFLFYDSLMPNVDINDDVKLSSIYTPDHLRMLGATTINLFRAIIIFVAMTEYENQFENNVNITQLEKTIKVFNDTYIPPKEQASSNVENTPSYKEGETATYIPTKETVLSNDVISPLYKYGETDKYLTIFSSYGKKSYLKKNPDGSVDRSKVYTSPPEGGSNKRYRTSRKSRKYQSKKKSRRYFQRRKRTHRRKSRRSRK